MPNALIVEDDAESRAALAELVQQEGFAVQTAASLSDARTALADQAPDLLLCDLMLPDGSGLELLEQLEGAPTEVVLITGHASVDSAVDALRKGAADYLTKPLDVPRLQTILAGIARTLDLKSEVATLRDELRKLGRFGPLVGASPPMSVVYDLIAKVAPTDATVFIVGESGTGKDLVAQAVHRLSRRRKGLCVALNCGAVSPTLIESELFGHERGSFTGAERSHKGHFERADRGTLFLDEITEMPIELQVKLLRVLESGTLTRLGGERLIEVDVRVVAATNRIPSEAVKEGKLREDLLYRLNVFPIQLPPLRDRGDDVALLASTFLQELNAQQGRGVQLASETVDLLRQYRWPGNVRELKNILHRAFILAENAIDPGCLPDELRPGVPVAPGAAATPISLPTEPAPMGDGAPVLHVRVGESVADAERRLILATLAFYDDNKQKAAEALGISIKTLYNRINEYRVE